jgi:hypothetical protein
MREHPVAHIGHRSPEHQSQAEPTPPSLESPSQEPENQELDHDYEGWTDHEMLVIERRSSVENEIQFNSDEGRRLAKMLKV